MPASTAVKIQDDNSFEVKPAKRKPEAIRFIGLSIAVFIFFLLYGYMLELIFTLPDMEQHGWFLTLIQFLNYSIFAFIQLLISGKGTDKKIPTQKYLLISVLTVGTMGFSNTSMGFLNYPTQVIFKSCKLIPVMIGSVIILKKRYTTVEVLSCCLMCLGLIWFTLADTTVQPAFNVRGVILVSCSLLFDAIIGNVQEGAMRLHGESSTTVVLYSYSIGFVIILFAQLWTNNLLSDIRFSLENPVEIFGRCFLLSLTGFCGVQVILKLVSEYGALVAVTVTTFRKALSICLSFIIFRKPFTLQYVWGGLLVIGGIYLNVSSKKKSSQVNFNWARSVCWRVTQGLWKREISNSKLINV